MRAAPTLSPSLQALLNAAGPAVGGGGGGGGGTGGGAGGGSTALGGGGTGGVGTATSSALRALVGGGSLGSSAPGQSTSVVRPRCLELAGLVNDRSIKKTVSLPLRKLTLKTTGATVIYLYSCRTWCTFGSLYFSPTYLEQRGKEGVARGP